MNKNIEDFNPSGVGAVNDKIFGLPFNYKTANIIILPVPWEVTVSYLSGAAGGPQAILNYSPQIDLYDFDVKDAWKTGLFLKKINKKLLKKNNKLRHFATKYIDHLEKNGDQNIPPKLQKIVKKINKGCEKMVDWVKNETKVIISDQKIPFVLGGDHSTPLGLLQALSETHDDFGILQIDAHADLRNAYENFEYSHASIMYNAMKIPQISKLVSVGVRDICEEEILFTEKNKDKIVPFYDYDLKNEQIEGKKTWAQQCDEIIENLPQKVYISFDIDGLSPEHCPNTGTPVAGGFQLHEMFFLLKKVVESGRTIIGGDLCEVSVGNNKKPSPEQEYNANVGARVLYKMCNLIGKSNGFLD